MEREEIHNRLRPLLKNFMLKALDASAVSESARLSKDLNIDSADLVDIVLAVEEQFSIKIPDEQLGRVKTVGDIVSLIQELQALAQVSG